MRYRRVVCHELIGIALHADSADFSGHSKAHMAYHEQVCAHAQKRCRVCCFFGRLLKRIAVYVYIHTYIHTYIYIYMYVCMYVCLPACLAACLPGCLPACLPACVPVGLSVRLCVCPSVSLSFISVCLSRVCTCLCLYVCMYVRTYVWVCVCVYCPRPWTTDGHSPLQKPANLHIVLIIGCRGVIHLPRRVTP